MMPEQASYERDFRTFQRSGDPAALGRVFDALAPSLLAVASQLMPSQAEDLVQNTFLRVIEKGDTFDATRPLRPWLLGILALEARTLRRAAKRRPDPGRLGSEGGESQEPITAAHATELADCVAVAVNELPASFRQVCMLRLVHGLDPIQISRVLDVPPATVRTRLHRGLERLRGALPAGLASALVAALASTTLAAVRAHVMTVAQQAVPVVPVAGSHTLAPSKGASVSSAGASGAVAILKWGLAAAAASVALLVGLEFAGSGGPTPTSGNGDAQTVAATPVDELADALPLQREAMQRPPTITPTDARASAPLPARGGVPVRAVTVDGRPVAGLTFVYHDPRMPRLDGSHLSFDNASVDLAAPSLRSMLASDAGIRAFAHEYAPYEAPVVAMIRGEPVDRPCHTTDGRGRFAVGDANDVEHLRIEGSDWMRYGVGRLPGEDDLVLIVGPSVRVAGRVVDPAGQAIEGAEVSLSLWVGSLPGIAQQFVGDGRYRYWSDTSNAAGTFDLGVVPAHASLAVDVQTRQHQRVTVASTEVHSPVLWTLTPKPAAERLQISGIVVSADGSPAGGARLAFGQDDGQADADGRFRIALTSVRADTLLTAWLPGLQPAIMEGLGSRIAQDPRSGHELVLRLGRPALEIAGRVLGVDGKPRAGIMVMLGDGVNDGSRFSYLESAIGRQRTERTDDNGRFVLRGLSERTYNVRAIDEKTLLVFDSGPVVAGTTDLELELPVDAFVPRLAGTLLDRFDHPIVGASVRVMFVRHRTRHGVMLMSRDGTATTDDAGRFVIDRCPWRNVTLAIGGKDLEQQIVAVPADGRPMRIVATRLLRFTIARGGGGTADRFAVLDAAGERLMSVAKKPEGTSMARVHRLPGEDSPVYQVDDRAVALLLLADKRVVRRIPLTLAAGALNRVNL